MVLFLLGLASVGSVLLYVFRASYIGELLISFLPYLVVLWLVLAVILLVMTLASRGRKKKVEFGLGCLVFVVLCVRGGGKVYDFYAVPTQEFEGGLKVWYSNLFARNPYPDAVKASIDKANPDVILFVEYGDYMQQETKDFLEKRGFVKTDRFSLDTIFVRRGVTFRRIGRYSQSLMIDWKGRRIIFHLKHTTSPTSEENMEKRNDWLDDIASSAREMTKTYPDAVHILVGDFNVSPWSRYYEEFQADLGLEWVNQTRQVPLLTTWTPYRPDIYDRETGGLMDIPWRGKAIMTAISWIQTHIDHLRVWGDAKVSIDTERIPGSDHKSFQFRIQ